MSNKKQYGFIGLGNMGSSIARDLITADTTLTVFDIQADVLEEFEQLGARTAASPADVASASDIVGICVRTDDQVRNILNGTDGVFSGARPGAIIVIHSTIHLATLAEMREAAESRGLHMVDAPVSRGTNAPKTKAINFMIGGAPEQVSKVIDYVSPAALSIIETGKPGSGMALKICNNILNWMMVLVMRDVFRLADKAEVDFNAFADLVSSNGLAGPMMLYAIKGRAARAGDGTTDRPKTHHVIDSAEANAVLSEKDLSAALEAAELLGVKMPSVEMGRAEVAQAVFDMLG